MGKINAEKTAKIGKGASLWRVNGWFHLRCYDRHRSPTTRQQALETRDQDRALELAQQRFYEWKAGTFDPWREAAAPARAEEQRRQGSPLLLEAMETYLAFQKSEQRAESTLKVTRQRLTQLDRHLAMVYSAEPRLQDIRPAMLRSFIFRPATARTTQRTLYVALHAFFRWCVKYDLLGEAPTDKIKRPGLPEPPPDFLTANQFHTLVLLIEDEYRRCGGSHERRVIWFRHLLVVAVYTGLRRGEIIKLRWGDVRLPTADEPQGWVTIRTAKHDTTGSVPLPLQAVEALRAVERWRVSESDDELVFKGPYSGKALVPQHVTAKFKRYVRRAGFSERLRFHSLRHTYASWLAQRGTSMKAIQELLRHKNIATTLRYMHLSPDHLQKAVADAFREHHALPAGRTRLQDLVK